MTACIHIHRFVDYMEGVVDCESSEFEYDLRLCEVRTARVYHLVSTEAILLYSRLQLGTVDFYPEDQRVTKELHCIFSIF